MPRLTIGYSTLAERSANIRFPSGDFAFSLFVQNPKQQTFVAPAGVEVVVVEGVGVAKSRNQALRSCQRELLIFGDDDVVFDPEQLGRAVAEFDKDPELVLLLLAAKDEQGRVRKRYPSAREKLNLFNCARAATYEIMLRPQAVRSLGVSFDESFGAGAKNYLGDEYIFISDLIRKGAKCEFAPIYVASHSADSSGERWGSREDRLARAAVFDRVFGPVSWLVRIGFALRRYRQLGGVAKALAFVFGR